MRSALLPMAVILALSIAATPAHADYRREYAAYGQALAAGDYAKAALHGEAAWRNAEKEIGETKTTAILAFNFAELVVVKEPQRALEPYERARAISQKLPTGLIPEDIEAGSAFARFALNAEDKNFRNVLDAALVERRAKDLPASPVSAYGWLLLSKYEGRTGDNKAALKFGDRALADAEALGEPIDRVLMRLALVNAAVFRVAPRGRTEADVTKAVQYLERAFGFFPPQVSIDTFDPILAQAIVWRISVSALAATEGPGPTPGSRAGSRDDFWKAMEAGKLVDPKDWVRWQTKPASCPARVEWDRVNIPKYPSSASNNDILGGALIGFDMKGDKVSRAIVLGESHKSGFGIATAKVMSAWKAKTPLAPECERNNIAMARFSL